MKRLLLAVILPSAWLAAGGTHLVAQTMHPANGPSYSESYCTGFISRDAVSRANFVLGSNESPNTDRLAGRTTLFLRGKDLTVGSRYSILRQIVDPNHEDSAPNQRKRLAELGNLYEDVGWLTVQSIENGTAIANFDFACGAAIPGDLLVPFDERPQLSYEKTDLSLGGFVPRSNPGPRGQVLGARDFLAAAGPDNIVYTDFGSNKGAKPGDYLAVTRGYAPEDYNHVSRISEKLPRGAEASAVDPVHVTVEEDRLMPSRIVGEMMILKVSPESSTGIITRVAAEVELGDVVQMENSDGSVGGGSAVTTAAASGGPEKNASGSGFRKFWASVRKKAWELR